MFMENRDMNTLASSADYADALLIARKAKNIALIIVFLMLVGQITLFFAWKYNYIAPTPPIAQTAPPTTLSTTQPALETPSIAAPTPQNPQLLAHYLLSLTSFIALLASIVTLVDLLLILNIQLIGRLLGTASLFKSFFLMLVLTLMLFPWQAFLNDANLSNVDFKIPGVLYSWTELKLNARFDGMGFWISTLRWMRFVGFPLVALLLLALVHFNSAKALRQSLGEEKPAGE
jgi:hypothetical protein